jgi:Flp pilus assembly protein TadD
MPNDAYVRNTLAVALARTNQFREAAAEMRAACRLRSVDKLFAENLACIERRLQGCAPQLSELQTSSAEGEQE